MLLSHPLLLLVSTDVTFLEITPFFLSSPVTSQEENDDLLEYTIASPAPLAPTPAPAPIKPPITQVCSRCQNPPASSSTLAASSSDPVQNDDLPIILRKGKCQFAHPISSFVSYNLCHLPLVLLLHLLILSLVLTLFVGLYLTLVGIVLWWMKCIL